MKPRALKADPTMMAQKTARSIPSTANYGKPGIASSLVVALFVSIFPWWVFRGAEYIDRENNLFFIDRLANKLYWFDFDSLLSKIMNEWGWNFLLLISVENLGLSGAQILGLIAFVSFLVASFFIVRGRQPGYAFLLFNPLFIDFVVSQSRLALTMSILTVGYLLYKRGSRAFIAPLVIAPFIHTSSILFIFLIGVALIFQNYVPARTSLRFFIATTTGLIISILTGPLLVTVLSSLEDRRVNYEDMNSPLIYTLFWICLYFYYFLINFATNSAKTDVFYISVSVLSIVVFGLVFGGYPIRFVAACFPFIVSSFFELPGRFRHLIFIYYFAMTFALWFFWLV
jgi:hypothetical protein|tara:strand:+ start:2803 stop:3828 length:1026 start_codon:yes stop_codon:yes gene_type:complete